MKCINCQKELTEQAMFCTGCGKKIPRCPTCGSLLTSRVRFCPRDGTPIPAEILELIPAAAPASAEPAKKCFCTRCGKPTAPGQKICDACQGGSSKTTAKKPAKTVTRAAKKEAGTKKNRLWLILIPVILVILLGLGALGYFAVTNDWLDFSWLEDLDISFFQDDREEEKDDRDEEDEEEDEDTLLREDAVAETTAPTEAPAEEVPATEAPTEAPIDYSKLVTDAHNLDCTYTSGSKEFTCTFRIPQINLPGSNTERINQEIYDAFYPVIMDAREYLEEYGFPGTSGEVSYRWAVNGQTLSLVIRNYAFPEASGWYEYTVYNLLVPDGTALSDRDILSYAGLSTESYHAAVKDALDARFRDRYRDFAQDDFYFSQLGRTLADDNIRGTRPYLNSDGQLCVIALEYSLVAGDAYYGDFVLDTTVKIEPEQQPEDDTEADTENATEKAKADPVYLNELAPYSTNGKIWIRSNDPATGTVHTNSDAPDCWKNTDIPGHTYGTVRDNKGNTYTYGIHVDGSTSKQYTITYALNGKYTRFSGYCACPEKAAVISAYVYNSSTKYSKYFEVYGDGKLLFTSNSMRYDRKPQFFEVDVTGVDELTILYPTSKGPNEIATLYDGLLE